MEDERKENLRVPLKLPTSQILLEIETRIENKEWRGTTFQGAVSTLYFAKNQKEIAWLGT